MTTGLYGKKSRVVIISGTERRNGTTASHSGFYKNMIIYGMEGSVAEGGVDYNFRNGTVFRILLEYDNLRRRNITRVIKTSFMFCNSVDGRQLLSVKF